MDSSSTAVSPTAAPSPPTDLINRDERSEHPGVAECTEQVINSRKRKGKFEEKRNENEESRKKQRLENRRRLLALPELEYTRGSIKQIIADNRRLDEMEVDTSWLDSNDDEPVVPANNDSDEDNISL